jgi:GNAT superfamily N-acetyltransferase
MLDLISIRWNQFWEEAREKSLRQALAKSLKRLFTTDMVVVPVFNQLANLKQNTNAEESSSLEFLVIDRTNQRMLAPEIHTTSRRLKLERNTAAGYYAYAVRSNGEIIGDIWCATPGSINCNPIHPDLAWLGISCEKDEAYMYDMFVVPGSRGKVITSFLLGNALNHLKKAGYQKVYGFYEKDNLPALWTHRLFGYSEMGKRRLIRCFFYKKTEPLSTQ